MYVSVCVCVCVCASFIVAGVIIVGKASLAFYCLVFGSQLGVSLVWS